MLNFNKKGAELALNAVIIAVVLLIVAFVITYIFVSKTGKTSETLESCAFKGGTCSDTTTCPEGSVKLPGSTDCTKDSKICCIEVIGK